MYDIEVSQGVTKLTDHEQHHDFLEEDSAKYYKYQCKQETGTVFFDVSDNGLFCSVMYLGKDQFPSPKQNIDKSYDNHLEAKCEANKFYYIAL